MDIQQTQQYFRLFFDCAKKANSDQKKLFKLLDKSGMRLYTFDFISTFHPDVKLQDHHKYHQFFAIPISDQELNPELLVAAKYMGKHDDKIGLYLHRAFIGEYLIPWPVAHKRINFKERKAHRKFPENLHYEERKVWRGEYEKCEKNPNYKGSRFFQKWRDIIYELNPDMPRYGL